MMKKRFFALLIAVIMTVCSACFFTACKQENPDDTGGIETPIDPPETPGETPENPGETPENPGETPENPGETPENPPSSGGGEFQGNLPSNPNREDSYEAK